MHYTPQNEQFAPGSRPRAPKGNSSEPTPVFQVQNLSFRRGLPLTKKKIHHFWVASCLSGSMGYIFSHKKRIQISTPNGCTSVPVYHQQKQLPLKKSHQQVFGVFKKLPPNSKSGALLDDQFVPLKPRVRFRRSAPVENTACF